MRSMVQFDHFHDPSSLGGNFLHVFQTSRFWKVLLKRLGACRIMPFFPISALFSEINSRNINYMAALNFRKCLDLRKNC